MIFRCSKNCGCTAILQELLCKAELTKNGTEIAKSSRKYAERQISRHHFAPAWKILTVHSSRFANPVLRCRTHIAWYYEGPFNSTSQSKMNNAKQKCGWKPMFMCKKPRYNVQTTNKYHLEMILAMSQTLYAFRFLKQQCVKEVWDGVSFWIPTFCDSNGGFRFLPVWRKIHSISPRKPIDVAGRSYL